MNSFPQSNLTDRFFTGRPNLATYLLCLGFLSPAHGAEEFEGFDDLYEEPDYLYGEPGYYPTAEESGLLGGTSRNMYGRHVGRLSPVGPDAGSLTASGIWHQDPEPTESFYERHDTFFRTVDNVLGPLTPSEMLFWESTGVGRDRAYGYADPGLLLTRDFNPDLATMKLGPLYLDFLRASAIVLYSDYDGSAPLANEDGWIGALSLDFMGGAQITNNLFLSLTGRAYYLPFDNKVGFFLGDGRPSNFRLAYEGSIDLWDYVVFNNFSINHRLTDILDEVEANEIAVSGRYRFGRADVRRGANYFDDAGIFFNNQLGTTFDGPIGDVLQASLSLERLDVWRSTDFDNHNYWHRFRGRLEYTGYNWGIVPYFQYDLTALRSADVLYESFWVGARARLSDNVRIDARAGYFRTHGLSSDLSRPIGEVGISQDITARTTHSLWAGARYATWEQGEDLFTNYARYSVVHSFGSRLTGSAFVQLSDTENLDGVSRDQRGWSANARLAADVSDYTNVSVSVNFDDFDTTLGDNFQRWIYRARVSQRLLPNVFGTAIFQYEDLQRDSGFGYDERMFMLSLDYLF